MNSIQAFKSACSAQSTRVSYASKGYKNEQQTQWLPAKAQLSNVENMRLDHLILPFFVDQNQLNIGHLIQSNRKIKNINNKYSRTKDILGKYLGGKKILKRDNNWGVPGGRGGFPGGSDGKESACSARDLGQEDPLEKGMAAHSGIIAWRIPWTEEPGGLQSMGSDITEWPSSSSWRKRAMFKAEKREKDADNRIWSQ